MIAKRVQRSKGTSRFARLVRYMVAAHGGINPVGWKRMADYVLDTKRTTTQGEKVASWRVTNCETDDPGDATALIEVTQAKNTRSKTDKTYHLVFSFPPGEQPSLEVLHAIEDELCAAIGLADHQRISAVHQDTDHFHVHVAINKVHPTGLQNIEPYFDKQRLMETCERLEIEHGLTRTNHGLTEGKAYERRERDGVDGDGGTRGRISGLPGDMEAHAGVDSLAGYVAREVAPAMRQASNWQELHAALADHGLQIRARGAGLVIGDAGLDLWCKARGAGRDLSAKALTGRLGPFEADRNRSTAEPRRRYSPRPRQAHPSSTALFAEYQRERQAALGGRREGFDAIRAERARENERIGQWAARQRMIIKASPGGASKKMMYATVQAQAVAARRANGESAAVKRKALTGRTAMPNWNEWLIVRANSGEVEALALLRARAEREEQMRGDLLTAGRSGRARTVIMETLKPQARKDGVMAYRTVDGGLVLDRASHVKAERATAGAALVAVSIAAERFEGQALDVRGSAQFRDDVARLAGLHGVRVRFADPAMETARQAAMPVPAPQKPPEALGRPDAGVSPAVVRWIEKRNEAGSKVPSIDYNRLWTPADAGQAIYQGRRRMEDGSEVLLLKRGEEMLVKPAGPRVAAKAAGWKIGQSVTVNADGRFMGMARRRGHSL